MADATTEYNLEQAKQQLDRCEQNYWQLQEVARRSLDELTALRHLLQTIAQQVGVEVAPTPAPAPPVQPTPRPAPMPKPPPDEPPTPPKPPEPLHTAGSGTRSSGSVGRGRSSGDIG